MADLHPGILRQETVELQNVGLVVPEILGKWIVGLGHQGAIPKSVVVADQSSHPDQLDQTLVVVEVIVFVRVHEDEIKGAVICFLHSKKMHHYSKLMDGLILKNDTI